ncbi:hypothetical protein EMWEY_00056200 [Eimeria maxima]|uniref:Uncharacterized protein n=1 Tax=Eimeria maxima TaxID=5804 RepID=U6M9Q2_EIMMA|nr:hypothetical protein EMWEY_00056200 [Eimeria maxima]CDJ59209.1 hypothetical protein EMWEY_00056200 [Eimeria maxima]
MGNQQHDVGPSLLEGAQPPQGRVGAAEPGPDNGDGEGAPWGRDVFVSRKSNGKNIGTATALLVTFLVLLMFRARHSLPSRLTSFLETPKLLMEKINLHKYMDDFNEAADAMNKAWEASEPSVREAFQTLFTPSLEDGQPLTEDPLAIINNHVAKMREFGVLSESSVKQRRDSAQHLQLLRSICRTVTLRLEELKWFVYMNKEYDVPVPVPGHDEPYTYPPLEVLEERVDDGLQASHFLKSVGLSGGEGTQKVDEMLADKLIYLLSVENKHNDCNLVARYYFEHFLQPFGEDDAFKGIPPAGTHQIPYSGEAFRTGSFARAAAQIFGESEGSTHYARIRKMHRIADNWTPKGVLEATKQQEKENAYSFGSRLSRKRDQLQALLQEGISYDDLLIRALFLL